MTDKIASQMKVCFKLVSLGHSGCLFVKTIENYLRVPFKCSHLLYGSVAYHITGKTLVCKRAELFKCSCRNGIFSMPNC